MILLRRFFSSISPVVLAALFISLLWNVTAWQYAIIGIALLIIFTHVYVLRWQVLTADFWWSFLPVILWVAGGLGFFLFLVNIYYQWALIILIAGIYGVYMENVFTFHYQPQKYSHLSLPKLSFYMMIVSTVFVFSSLFALVVISSIPFWVIAVVSPIYAALAMAVLFRGYGVLNRENIWLIILVGIGSFELSWVLHYLPTAYTVNGALLALYMYSVPSIVLMVARDAIEKNVVLQYGIVALVTATAILLTAQWI